MSENEAQHKDRLQQVLQRLFHHNLSININKCNFGKRQVKFLRYQIDSKGFQPNSERIDAIINYPTPSTVMELRRFLGMFNYYRPCIQNSAQLQLPLTKYLKNSKKNDKTPISWTTEATLAFQACKEALSAVTHTAYPSPDACLALTTDASADAIGAALEQIE